MTVEETEDHFDEPDPETDSYDEPEFDEFISMVNSDETEYGEVKLGEDGWPDDEGEIELHGDDDMSVQDELYSLDDIPDSPDDVSTTARLPMATPLNPVRKATLRHPGAVRRAGHPSGRSVQQKASARRTGMSVVAPALSVVAGLASCLAVLVPLSLHELGSLDRLLAPVLSVATYFAVWRASEEGHLVTAMIGVGVLVSALAAASLSMLVLPLVVVVALAARPKV